MKILNKKEQLRKRIAELEDTIAYTETVYHAARKRQTRKDNWGIFSFVSDEYWHLEYVCKNVMQQLNHLKEYRDVLSDMYSLEK